jgi:hypothetical protein
MTLSPPVRFSTEIPFPISNIDATLATSKDETTQGNITIDACSEYTSYHASLDYFAKSGKLRLLHDATGRPIVFVINRDNVCIVLNVFDDLGADDTSSNYASCNLVWKSARAGQAPTSPPRASQWPHTMSL